MRLLTGVLLLWALLLAGCQPEEQAARQQEVAAAESAATVADATKIDAEEETRRLTKWFDARYEEELQFSPIELAWLGRKDRNDQLDDMSLAGWEKWRDWKAASVEQLRRDFDYASLTPDGQESYDLWVYQYERALAAEPYLRQGYGTGPVFPFTQMFGTQSWLPTFVLNLHKVDTADDAEALVKRIGAIGRAIGQVQVRAEAAAENGIRPPRFAYEVAIEEAEKQFAGAPFIESEQDAPLWGFTKAKLDALRDAGEIDQDGADRLRTAAFTALQDEFLPAYEDLVAWLREDIANADSEARGVGALPNGEEFYRFALEEMTTTAMAPAEIHELGLAEVARIRGEMEAIRDEVGFEGDLSAFFTFLREDGQFRYPNTDAGREAYLEESRAFLAGIESRLPEYFGLLPKAELEVKRVEPFREQDGGVQHYMAGSPDGERPGVYYAHLSDMDAYSTSDMETIAYHEGNPGHHMQISIAQELEGIPKFRTQSNVTAYSEGWGLYAEQLAEEMGAFTDPYKRFGRLNSEIWRAVRLVVDSGLHAKGWGEEQAVQYFLANSSLPEDAVRFEVRRYLVWPGQATAYKVGMLKILELRADAYQTLGEKFDIRGFHDAVLGGGALPLPLLEKRVNRWIEETKQG